MALLREVGKQATILQSYVALGSRSDVERYRAMEAMRECGDSGRWCLRLALHQSGQPRVQFAAAVVLHGLGDRQGLMTLTEALKWRLPTEPLIVSELESAFIAIGSPDAITALLTVWNMLPDWGDHEAVRTTICRVWAAVRNPVVLPALAARALHNPARFERTAAAFGEMAIPTLREMTRSQDVRARCLAVQTLRHIPGPSAFSTLVPLLRDPERAVRTLIPEAIEQAGSPLPTVVEISKAVRNGYTSVAAVIALKRANPADLSDTLTAMLEVWRPEAGDSNDTEIMLISLPALLETVADEPRVLGVLCNTLRNRADPAVAVALIQAIESLTRGSVPPDQAAMDTLFCQITEPNPAVREQAALTLARLGDMFPARAIAFLEDCKPQDSILSQLQLILRGGRDAGQAATQAVQQVSKWWARLTSDSPDAMHGAGEIAQFSSALSKNDPRLPDMLRSMLSGAIRRETRPLKPFQVEDTTAFMVLALRALSRLGLPAALCAWPEIVAVLHLPAQRFAATGQPPDLKAKEATGTAAAETLITLYGADSFCLFLEALCSPYAEVIRTGIAALGMLGDSRALPHLRPIAANDRHPYRAMAIQAIAQIQRTNPEMMSLLRGSSTTAAEPDHLLRAAYGNTGAISSDLLLRPTTDRPDPSERCAVLPEMGTAKPEP